MKPEIMLRLEVALCQTHGDREMNGIEIIRYFEKALYRTVLGRESEENKDDTTLCKSIQ